MLVGLRIISILYDLFLASMLFYRPLSKINMKKKPLVALFFILIFHGELVFLFSESRIFLVSNLLLNILEYYLIGLNFDYPIRQSSFWILLQTSLSLLAGAVLNQGIQLILPLGELSKNLEAISLYLGISFILSTGITLILRKLLLSHQKLRIATSKGNWLYQFIVPLLSIFFAFTISAIQGGVFGADYLSIISLSSLIVLTLSSLYFNLYLARQQQQYYQNQLEKEQLQFQVREIQQSQEEYQRLQSLRHDLKINI
ncbi:sensor histidine kinase [Streptococcus sp. HSISS3]|nr:sensor histidine kinase [Streptococcus sp. HSISS3]